MLKSAVLLAALVSAGSASAQMLTLKRDLDIGTAEGEPAYEFSRVGSIAVGNDGTIYVVNGASVSIRAFTPQGKFIREMGRRGNGPGEFQNIGSIRVSGDTILVQEGPLRTTLFDRTGKVITTWRTEYDPQTRATVTTVAAVPGGWLVSRFAAGFAPVGQERSSPIELAFTTEPQKGLQAALRPVTSYVWMRSFGIAITGGLGAGGQTSSQPLFDPLGRHAVDNRGQIYVSPGYDYRVDVYDVTGKIVRTIARPHTPVPISAKLIADYRKESSTYFDTAKAQHAEIGNATRLRQLLIIRSAAEGKGKLPTREHLPALGLLFVSPQGTVLVERPDLLPNPLLPELPTALNKPQPAFYDLFDPTGRFIGSVRFGANFRPRAVTENAILGVERDELDVEHVVRYTFR
jgi:hypothetical protein